jgi:hypothetical protein
MAEIESLTATQVVPDNSPTHIFDSRSLDSLVPPLPLGPIPFDDAPSFAGPASLAPLAPLSAPASRPAPSATPGHVSSPALAGPPSVSTLSQSHASFFEPDRPTSPDAASQLSGLSVVSRLSELPPGWSDARQRRRKVALGVMSIVGLASAGVLLAGLVGSKPASTRLDVASSRGLPPTPPERALGDAPPPPEPTEPAVAASAPPTPSAAPTQATAPKAAPKTTYPAPPTPAPRPPPAAPAAMPARPRPAGGDCSPPYTIDGQGIRRIKPQCL